MPGIVKERAMNTLTQNFIFAHLPSQFSNSTNCIRAY